MCYETKLEAAIFVAKHNNSKSVLGKSFHGKSENDDYTVENYVES